MRVGFRPALGVALLLLVCGCAQSTSPSASVVPSASPSEVAVGALPPGCEPMDLRDANGERIELDGTWTEASGGNQMTWWLRTEGDCVWGSGHVADIAAPGAPAAAPHTVQSLSGRVGGDFVITGGILFLGPRPLGNLPPYSPLRMLLQFDDAGGLVLREDREPGAVGPRCPEPTAYCPAPLVLERAD